MLELGAWRWAGEGKERGGDEADGVRPVVVGRGVALEGADMVGGGGVVAQRLWWPLWGWW